MLPGMELMGCTDLAVPAGVMRHVVRIESSFNPYAIGVVGGRLARQPRSLSEAVSTAHMLEREGYNFSLGLAQVNRYNLTHQGLVTYENAFDVCPNLQAGSRILADCYHRSGSDWGKALSCYYSGNFVTGFRHGYVQKVLASWRGEAGGLPAVVGQPVESGVAGTARGANASELSSMVMRRIAEAAGPSDLPRTVHSQASVQAPSRLHAGAVLAGHGASSPAGERTRLADSPVVLQAMDAGGTRQAQGDPPQALAAQPASPRKDDAFVF